MFKNLSLDALGVSGRSSEIIELALSYGFKGIDLDMVDFAQQVKTQGLPASRRLIDSAKLKIGSFTLPTDWQHDEATYKADLARLGETAELARQMGCTRAVTMIEPSSDMRPYHENFELHRKRFAEIGEALAAYQIRLGVGLLAATKLREGRSFGFMQSADAVLMLLHTVGSPHVGLALDVWNWHLGGGTLEQIRGLGGERIITVDLADADAELTADNATESARKLPGETGVIDSLAVVAALAEMGYDGPVTPKPHRDQFPGHGRDKIVKAAGATLEEIWKAAGIGPSARKHAQPERVGGRM